MPVGLPGSGKSTYIKNEYSTKSDTVILSSDALRIELGFLPGTHNDVVFNLMLKKSCESLRAGLNVVYDATNLSRKNRISVLEKVRKYADSCECILFVVDPEICIKRDALRDPVAVVGPFVIDHMLKSFNVPMYCEGFDVISVVVNDSCTHTLQEFLLQTKDFDQDNPHHTLSLYDHLQMTMQIAENANNGLLRDAALYHDIGKLWTKVYENSKGEETTVAHYYGHENVGAYMYLIGVASIIKDFPALIDHHLYVAALINWHMRPYIEMNSTKREREYKMLGEDFVDHLKILHSSDVQAH